MAYQSLIDKLEYVYRGFWKEYGANCVDHLPLVSEGMLFFSSEEMN